MLKYKLPKPSMKRDYIFNIFGSMINSGVSLILLIIVSYILGESAAGIFTLAFSSAQMIYVIGEFELRILQVTSIDKDVTFSDMFGYRLLSVAAMIIFSVIFVFFKQFDFDKSLALLLLTFYMAEVALSDIFQGNMQRHDYLAVGGFSQGGIVGSAAVCFTAVLFLTKNMYYAIIGMIVMAGLWVLFFDIPFNRNFDAPIPRFKWNNIKKIFLSTFPLFISVFLNQYTLNTPKYAIDKYLTNIDQSHYGYLLMPTFFINLLGIFAFRPQYVSLSKKLYTQGKKSFVKSIIPMYCMVGAFTVCVLLGGYLLGIPILNVFYNTNLNDSKHLLMILLLAGGISAASSLTINLVTILRTQKFSLIAYIVTFTVAQFIPDIFVEHWGMLGASLSYLVVTLTLFVFSFTIFLICLKKKKISLINIEEYEKREECKNA